MAPFVVLDASVVGAWLFAESRSAQAQTVLQALDQGRIIALAPDRFAEELLRVCQKKSLPQPHGAGVPQSHAWERFLEAVTSPITLLASNELHERAWDLANTAALTTHDALYLALAERWGAELWTLDELLATRGVAAYPKVYDLGSCVFPH